MNPADEEGGSQKLWWVFEPQIPLLGSPQVERLSNTWTVHAGMASSKPAALVSSVSLQSIPLHAPWEPDLALL